MTLKQQDQLFDEKLRNYEKKLVQFFIDIGEQKRVNPKFLKMSSYLILHKKLTQKQLKELTGFSIGTISTFLSILLGTGFYEKQRIEGTHTYTYRYKGNVEDFTTKGIEIALDSFLNSESFLKKKKEELKTLMKQNKKGAKHLSQRIDEIISIFTFYEDFFSKMKNDDFGDE